MTLDASFERSRESSARAQVPAQLLSEQMNRDLRAQLGSTYVHTP